MKLIYCKRSSDFLTFHKNLNYSTIINLYKIFLKLVNRRMIDEQKQLFMSHKKKNESTVAAFEYASTAKCDVITTLDDSACAHFCESGDRLTKRVIREHFFSFLFFKTSIMVGKRRGIRNSLPRLYIREIRPGSTIYTPKIYAFLRISFFLENPGFFILSDDRKIYFCNGSLRNP